METDNLIPQQDNSPMPSSSARAVRDAVRPGVTAQWKSFLVAAAVLAICFALPLFRLATFAWGEELYSYILLIPFITAYFIRLKWKSLPTTSRPMYGPGIALSVAGLAALVLRFLILRSTPQLDIEDGSALAMLALYFFLLGAACIFLGWENLRACAFSMAMLAFIIPMPVFLRDGIEVFLQYGSAYAAHGMFRLYGTPVVRNDLVFILPGMPQGILVAPECSGIHSTLILFITSLMASYLFLRTKGSRLILCLAVLPIALIRNGFRVFTIGELCVSYGPKMIDSFIHRKGGPIFFALSLIPFFALLVFLHRRERRQRQARPANR